MTHKPMSARKAIRLHCLECCNGSQFEVANCTVERCSHFNFRMGVRGPDQDTSPAKALRGRCLDCGQSKQAVRLCQVDECPSHPFRFGKSPYIKRSSSATSSPKTSQ